MAGLTTTFHRLFKTHHSTKTTLLSFSCSRSHILSFPSASLRWRPLISTTLFAANPSMMSWENEKSDISSIRSDDVRLIDEQQNMVGIVSKAKALQMANDAEMDLVILSLDANPPVVRIMDYPKYKYEQQKKKREQQKKASQVDLKVVKLGPRIDMHDYSLRLKRARKFLSDGDKVKVWVSYKDKHNKKVYESIKDEFKRIATELITRFRKDIGEMAVEQDKCFHKYDNMFVLLVPNKAVLQKASRTSTKEEENSTMPGSLG